MKTLLTARRAEIAQSIGLPLIEMEKHVDAALENEAQLRLAAIAGRRKGHLPLEAGEDALALLAGATAKILEARREIHQAHRILRKVQDELGVGPIAYGDYGDSPDESFTRGADERPVLAAVA